MAEFDVTIGGRTYEVNAPDEATAARAAQQFHAKEGERRQQAIAADQAAQREAFKRDEANRPLGERILTNLGAGLDTTWQGAKQLASKVGIGEGVGDEELADSRRRKAELAEGTRGGGFIQGVGEALPTLALPVGAAGSVGKAALMSAAGGAASGALRPVLESESRLMNTAIGGATGAAVPYVTRGLTKAVQHFTQPGRGAAEAGGKVLKRAVERAGEDPAEIARRLALPRTNAVTRDIPLTAAEHARSAGLATRELGARGRMVPEFAELAQRQNEAIFEAATQRAGREGTDAVIDAAVAAREQATKPLRDIAMERAGKFSHVGEPLERNVADLTARTAKGTEARRLADLTRDMLGENPNPTQLYEFRKLLASKLGGPHMPGDDVAAITKGAAKETMEMIDAITARLDEAGARKAGSQQPFSDYLAEYASRSKPVSSARAQQEITNRLSDIVKQVGDAPHVTANKLHQAVKASEKTKRGGFDRMTTEARQRYQDLEDFLAHKEAPMNAAKIGGTGGGGSQTAMQKFLVGASDFVAPGYGGQIMRQVMNRLDDSARAEVDRLLMDPVATGNALRAAIQAGQPLSRAQQAALMLMRSGATAGTAGFLAQ